MRAIRQFVRWFLVVVCVGLLLAIFSGLVGEWFIELAKEKGYYEQPSAHWDAAMTAFSGYVTQAWVLLVAAVVAGLTCGVWLDASLRLPYWRRKSADKAKAVVAPLKWIQAAKAEPAYSEATSLLERLIRRLTDEGGDPRDKIIGVMIDRKIKDASDQASVRFANILDVDNLESAQEAFGDFYRSYQEVSGWILQAGELCAFAFSTDAQYRRWRELDHEFLLCLRELVADDRHRTVANSVRATGYGEAVRASLDDIARANLTLEQSYHAIQKVVQEKVQLSEQLSSEQSAIESDELENLNAEETSLFSNQAQGNARGRLSGLGGAKSKVKIVYKSLLERDLAISIGSLFHETGWKVEFNDVPSPEISSRAVGGVLVEGYNEYLMNSVAHSISSCGVSNVEWKPMSPPLLIASPKWHRAQTFIRISVFSSISVN